MKRIFRLSRKAELGLLILWLLAGLGADAAKAASVASSHAHKMVRTWLTENARPMNCRLGSEVNSVQTFNDSAGQPVYYVVHLNPNGFVIVPADDEVEPVICFSSQGSYDPSDRNPLGAMVSRDLPARVNAVRAAQKKMLAIQTADSLTENETALRKSADKARGKWTHLLSQPEMSPSPLTSLGTITDVRVAPLLKSKWGQDVAGSKACFNYYTPPGPDGDVNNYYCGCVATAMAQYMRYNKYPTAGVGTGCFDITVGGSWISDGGCLRGGNGSGGAYDWDNMTLDPGGTTAECQAIGALTYDAGVSVSMDYESDGSGAYLSDAASALVDTFYYSNAIYAYNGGSNIGGAALYGMVNPNLDFNNPVLLGIHKGETIGHAVVADGYGYQGSTLYHHLNMGWDGSDDAWYNLPTIDSSPAFNIVNGIVYNIYTSGSGEIISGRVTFVDSGSPVANATVTAEKAGGETYTSQTNSKGIYAIGNVPSSSTYTISVSKTGYLFNSQTASTDTSQNGEAVSGNCWAVDFTGTQAASVPVASNTSTTAIVNVTKDIMLQAFDDGEPDPPGALTYIITSLPRRGTLAEPCVGIINTVPYSLSNYGKDVNYLSTSNYTGYDCFTFEVNDGQYESNEATIGVTIQPPLPELIYEANFNNGLLPAGWTIVDDFNDGYTWNLTNPGDRSSAYWTGIFMIVDSDYAGSNVIMDEQLITKGFDFTGLADVNLCFKHDFRHYAGEIGDVDVCVPGGKWQNVKRYRGKNYSGPVELALSSFGADDCYNVKIRWHYYDANYCWYWGIDDVQIKAADDVPVVSIDKCTVTAGSKDRTDKISLSGLLRATIYDLNDANCIKVTVSSDDINNPLDINFPIDGNTLKKNKYSCSKTDISGVKKSFTYDPKTRKFAFAASNADLSGLGCPVAVGVIIGDYNSLTDVYETVVNGPKTPIPIKLMMSIKDVLRIDKCTIKHGKDPNTDQLTVKGAFTVQYSDISEVNMVEHDLVVTLDANDTQTFTLPVGSFKAGKNKFTCSKVPVTEPNGGIAAATFDFNASTFTLTISKTNIPDIEGIVDLGIAFAGFDQTKQVVIPP